MKRCPEHPEASVYAKVRTMVDWQCQGEAPACRPVIHRKEADGAPPPCLHCGAAMKPGTPRSFEDLHCSACQNRVGTSAFR